jgi:hypothetical protein
VSLLKQARMLRRKSRTLFRSSHSAKRECTLRMCQELLVRFGSMDRKSRRSVVLIASLWLSGLSIPRSVHWLTGRSRSTRGARRE